MRLFIRNTFVDNLELHYTKDELIANLKDETDLFLKLYIANTDKKNKLIEDIVINFNNGQVISDLSEGQKKQLLIKAALEFAGQEDTLFLLDEPDAHVHVSNKKFVFEILKDYIINRHIIMTTHSPTICRRSQHYGFTNSLVLLEAGRVKQIENELEAAKNLVDDDAIIKLLFSTKDIILVEGKSDDLYISKAIMHFRSDYPTLDFDFLRLGGTDGDNVKSLLDKIAINNLLRKIIIIVDRDQGGMNVHESLFAGSNKHKQNIMIEPLQTPYNNTYFLMLPHKIPSKQCGDFAIEDYFSNQIKRELTKEQIDTLFVDTEIFGKFPNVKNNLKANLLPDFCTNKSTPSDMLGFKLLLNYLKEIVDKPLTSNR